MTTQDPKAVQWKMVLVKPTREMINEGIFTSQEWDARNRR